MGKDLVMKRIRSGSGAVAEMGTVVLCNLTGYFVVDNLTQIIPFEDYKDQRFKIGESDAVPGIEMALRFSKVGDVLRVKFNSKFGYGHDGRPAINISESKELVNGAAESAGQEKKVIAPIPPDTDLEYEIEVLTHLCDGAIEPELLNKYPFLVNDSKQLGVEELEVARARHTDRLVALTELSQRKEAGNRWFSYGDFSRAARAYSKGTQVADRYFNGNANTKDRNAEALQSLSQSGGQEGGAGVAQAEAALAEAEKEKEAQRRRFQSGDEEVLGAYVSCLNNMAASQLRLGQSAKAKDLCIRVLELDPCNHKALLRAAKAALSTHVSALLHISY